MKKLLLTFATGLLLTSISSAQQSAGDYFLYAGTYTNPTPKTASGSKGIHAWRFDSNTGALTSIGVVAETVNPAHVWASPDDRFLYAVNWSTGDAAGDTVSAFGIDRKTGALKFLNKVSSHGESPNQIVVDPTGRVAMTVTYNGGTVTAFGVQPDGRLTEAIYTEKHAGTPLSPKQPGPRAHGVVFSQDGRWAYVAQLGLDRVYTYRIDQAARKVMPAEPPFVTMQAGSGPRRLQLHPSGKYLYVNHETDSQVSVFAVDGANLTHMQTLSTLPADYKGNNSTAEIQIDHRGIWLYVTNRGHDSLAHYAIDFGKGVLKLVGHIPSGGRTPRNIIMDPTNQYIVAANQNGDNIVVFRHDSVTGNLTPSGAIGQVPQPGGMAFVKAQ
jgi:6-phosphogluconolactonase